MTQVKSKRRYDFTGRQAQAQRSRQAILDAAERQFLDTGYAATTIDAITREAACQWRRSTRRSVASRAWSARSTNEA
jgi:AcrR family transcriptional regulator